MCSDRYAPKPRFQAGDAQHTALLESVLIGHEDWVHSVAWQPLAASASAQRPCLLSASMDRTMMLWRPDTATGSCMLPLNMSFANAGWSFCSGMPIKLLSLSFAGLWMSEDSVGDAGASHLGYYR